ncbi:copper amine oxidase N-terminal domain-containing protein [Thermovenabulum sp.]|uniref:copper amine oxidase N-terminal domain-containing protein n=1 Tax=Thermovenabulum sp. TaxID=3100335 RepID=UPI003C7D210E
MKGFFKIISLTLILVMVLSTVAFAKPNGTVPGKGLQAKEKVMQSVKEKNIMEKIDKVIEEKVKEFLKDPKVQERLKNLIKEQLEKREKAKANIVMNPKKVQEFKKKVKLNGKEGKFDAPPVIKDGRILIPINVIKNVLNAEVKWDEQNKVVYIIKGDKTVAIVLGSMEIIVTEPGKENKITIDVPALSINNRTYVPIRVLRDIFGLKVYQDKNGDVQVEGSNEQQAGNQSNNENTNSTSNTSDTSSNQGTTGQGEQTNDQQNQTMQTGTTDQNQGNNSGSSESISEQSQEQTTTQNQ